MERSVFDSMSLFEAIRYVAERMNGNLEESDVENIAGKIISIFGDSPTPEQIVVIVNNYDDYFIEDAYVLSDGTVFLDDHSGFEPEVFDNIVEFYMVYTARKNAYKYPDTVQTVLRMQVV